MSMMLSPGEGQEDHGPVAEINTTPLIDVLLVLLIMLIVTIPMQMHAVTLDMPGGPPPAAPSPQVVAVDVGPAGGIRWNGEAVADGDALEARLRAAAALAAPPELHVRPQAGALYGDVAVVLSAAQRTGLTKVGIVDGREVAR